MSPRFSRVPNGPEDIFKDPASNGKEGDGNGIRMVLSGNEAYARGLYEAGARFVSMYPGTPVSEIGDIWSYFAAMTEGVYYDLAVNETVAFEAAVGASWSGLRSAVCFKHLGMNLISDALHAVMYSGVDTDRRAGLVIICGGDPSIKSSTNALDVRQFSFHTFLPILTPSNVQECKDFVELGFRLSESIGLPVMIYSPSELNHSSGDVVFNENLTLNEKISAGRFYTGLVGKSGFFRRNPDRFLNAIHWALHNQSLLLDKISLLKSGALAEAGGFQYYIRRGSKDALLPVFIDGKSFNVRAAIITEGLAWSHVSNLLLGWGLNLPRLRVIRPYPLDEGAVVRFIRDFSPGILIIIEEQEAFIEMQIAPLILGEIDNPPIILGKNVIPRSGALSPDRIADALSNTEIDITPRQYMLLTGGKSEEETLKIPGLESGDIRRYHLKIGIEFTLDKRPAFLKDWLKVLSDRKLPIREPTFCPGCSHRSVFYALRKAVDYYQRKSGRIPVFGGDIGCYTMSMSAPYETMDWLICMGAGLGIANGVARVIDPERQYVIAMVGDSTFFHTGIQPLINLIKNKLDVMVLILDNYFSAMTGHQPSPSTPSELSGKRSADEISVETALDNPPENARNGSPDGNMGAPIDLKEFLRNIAKYAENPVFERFDGYDIIRMKTRFIDLLGKKGLKIVYVGAECALNKSRRIKSLKKKYKGMYSETLISISEDCVKCNECFERLGCTAIQEMDDLYYIDHSRCLGEFCQSCVDICPNRTIYKTIVNPHLPRIDKLAEQFEKNKEGE